MRGLSFGRWVLVGLDSFAAVVCVLGGTIAAAFFDGSWWLPVLAAVYLATFSAEARRIRRRFTGGSEPV